MAKTFSSYFDLLLSQRIRTSPASGTHTQSALSCAVESSRRMQASMLQYRWKGPSSMHRTTEPGSLAAAAAPTTSDWRTLPSPHKHAQPSHQTSTSVTSGAMHSLRAGKNGNSGSSRSTSPAAPAQLSSPHGLKQPKYPLQTVTDPLHPTSNSSHTPHASHHTHYQLGPRPSSCPQLLLLQQRLSHPPPWLLLQLQLPLHARAWQGCQQAACQQAHGAWCRCPAVHLLDW